MVAKQWEVERYLWSGNRAWKSENHEIMYTTFHLRKFTHIQYFLLNKDFKPRVLAVYIEHLNNPQAEWNILHPVEFKLFLKSFRRLKHQSFTPDWSRLRVKSNVVSTLAQSKSQESEILCWRSSNVDCVELITHSAIRIATSNPWRWWKSRLSPGGNLSFETFSFSIGKSIWKHWKENILSRSIIKQKTTARLEQISFLEYFCAFKNPAKDWMENEFSFFFNFIFVFEASFVMVILQCPTLNEAKRTKLKSRTTFPKRALSFLL